MIDYEVFTRLDEVPLATFKSEWQFSEKETVFVFSNEGKRVFIVNQITHDVYPNLKHVVRLNCQEKKNYY